jgi:dTDP-4-dehydrorhamnose reductase
VGDPDDALCVEVVRAIMTFLITGADGQLGRLLTRTLAEYGAVVACTRSDLDITNAAQVMSVIGEARPTVVVNCAAFNDVDAAEDEQQRAFDINAMAVRTLARAARDLDAILVHYSTDFVFDGNTSRPYTELDPPAPRSAYAASKLVGEWMAEDALRWYVLRVESLFGVAHTPGVTRVGSIDRIITAIERREPARVFRDRIVSPSYLVDVAAATHSLLAHKAPSGTYHVVNTGQCTWYELAQHITGVIGGSEQLVPVDFVAMSMKAARPRFAALDNARLAAAGYVMPTWQDAIDRYLSFRQRPATI